MQAQLSQLNLSPNDLLRRAWQTNAPLALFGVASAIYLALALVGLIVDPRMVLNEPLWIKPIKFGLSTMIYTISFLWLLTYIVGRPRTIRAVSWITSIGLSIELILIGYQALRGVRSHFNNSTPFDAAIFSVMGVAILVVWLAGAVAAVLLIRQTITSRPFGLALKLGLALALIGGALGVPMTIPTDSQISLLRAGETPQYTGAHSVGVADGGAGLPFVGWSTEGGDLRIGHFIGLHALQVLPLIGWVVVNRSRHLSERQQSSLIWLAGGGYLGIVALTTWQALRGQPLIAPDGLTLAAFAALIAAVGVAAALVLRTPRRA